MIALLQFRSDQSGWHEVKCIYDGMGVPYSQYVILNMTSPFLNAELIIEIVKNAQGVILGGNGEGGYEETDPMKRKVFETVRLKTHRVLSVLEEREIPVFGTCFGHQIIADYIGGTVEADKSQAETGIIPITLTSQGRLDPIYSSFPGTFSAAEGHKSSVCTLPSEAIILASSERCLIQSFRYRKMIGTQFHPEFNQQDLADRLEMYPEYMANSIKSGDEDTELMVKRLLANFRKSLYKG